MVVSFPKMIFIQRTIILGSISLGRHCNCWLSDYELVKTIRVPYIGGDQEVENVGLQTWRASLLLAEYIHFNSELFIGTHILELGAGLVL